MLSRRIASASLLVAAFGCPACQTVDRAGQDVLVVGTFPIHALTTPYQETAAQMNEPGTSAWTSPFIFAGHFAEDVGVTVISAGDLGISPAIGVVEMTSRKENIAPLRMYSFNGFPPEFHKQNARDVESDVAHGAAVAAAVVVVVGVIFVACYYDVCPQQSTNGWTNDPPMRRSHVKPAPGNVP